MMEVANDLLEAFDENRDADPSFPILRAMSYIKEETGLLGDYNDGQAVLDLSGESIYVTGRSTTLGAHNALLDWVQDQDDLRLGSITVTKVGGDPRPTVTIRADE